MSAISAAASHPAVTFNVRILDEDGSALAKLIPGLIEHQAKAQEQLSKLLPPPGPDLKTFKPTKTFKLLHASLAEVAKIQGVIKDKIVDVHYGLGLADRYKVVVSYDSVHNLPQAFGLLVLNRADVKGKKSIELYSLITAFRNLDLPGNTEDPQRVKGGGSSLIKFSKELAKQQKANYLYLEAAGSAMSFYEKFGFKEVNPGFVDPRFRDDIYGMLRTPLFVDVTGDAPSNTSRL